MVGGIEFEVLCDLWVVLKKASSTKGMTVSLGFVFAVWSVWPMYLLQIEKEDSEEAVAKKNTNETTPLNIQKELDRQELDD